MLRIPASLLAIIGSVLSTLEGVSIMPMRNAFVDLVILGRLPMTNWQITFDPLFFFFVTVIIGWLAGYAYKQARIGMDEIMWNPQELEGVSL